MELTAAGMKAAWQRQAVPATCSMGLAIRAATGRTLPIDEHCRCGKADKWSENRPLQHVVVRSSSCPATYQAELTAHALRLAQVRHSYPVHQPEVPAQCSQLSSDPIQAAAQQLVQL